MKEKVMGYYVNPSDCTKETWLSDFGIEIPPIKLSKVRESWKALFKRSYLPVVLVNNAMFSAAGIAYSERELEAFLQPNDKRPKRFFKVPCKALYGVCPELKDIMN
jgi:hypothetical protein